MLETFVADYGYAALFFGTFVEGEAIVLLGAIGAHLGYLELPWVIAWSFAGTLFADQLYFFIGRRKGRALLRRRPQWQARADRVLMQLHRYHVGFMLSFRFFYGLRTVTPFVIGMLPVSTGRFLFYNAVGGLIWATAVASIGYFSGNILETLTGKVRHYELAAAVLAIAAALLLAGAAIYWRRRGDVRRR